MRKRIYEEIEQERLRQIKKWGTPKHSKELMLAILVEEVGEVAKAICEYYQSKDTNWLHNYREELIQSAAVCIQAIEQINMPNAPICRLCEAVLIKSLRKPTWYCPNWQDKVIGEHTWMKDNEYKDLMSPISPTMTRVVNDIKSGIPVDLEQTKQDLEKENS